MPWQCAGSLTTCGMPRGGRYEPPSHRLVRMTAQPKRRRPVPDCPQCGGKGFASVTGWPTECTACWPQPRASVSQIGESERRAERRFSQEPQLHTAHGDLL
jgi:hypothetical protein